MKDSIFTLKILLTLTSLSLSQVQASNVDMNSKKDCAPKKNNLKEFTTYTHSFKESICAMAMGGKPEFCKGLKKVAWYSERDNSMSDANDKAGRAMITVYGDRFVQGTQVCPGVFLTVAHGFGLDDDTGKTKIKKRQTSLHPYPINKKSFRKKTGINFKYYSPRLDGKDSQRNDPLMDFVFIKADPKKLKRYARKNKLKYSPSDYIVPVRASTKDLIRYSNDEDIDVHLYRAKTGYKKDRKDLEFPDFNKRIRGKSLSKVYDKPQRVNVRCELKLNMEGKTIGSCPSEDGVSGSPYVTKIKGKQYMVGLHTSGAEEKREISFEDDYSEMNAFIHSDTLCSYYEKVCGQSCPKLRDLVKEDKDFLKKQKAYEAELVESVSKACGISNKQCGAKSYELSIKYRDGSFKYRVGSFKPDYKKSATYLIQAADKKYPSAYLDLAMLHESGKYGAIINAGALASEYLKAFAKKSKTKWYYYNLFELSDSFEPDADKAASYYFKALEAGDASLLNRKAKSWNLKTGKALQLLLKDDGYYTGAIDGILGKGTKAAFRKLCKCK